MALAALDAMLEPARWEPLPSKAFNVRDPSTAAEVDAALHEIDILPDHGREDGVGPGPDPDLDPSRRRS